MKGYVANIGELSLSNNNFRKVLYTAPHCQLVVMSLLPGEDIGEEVHTLDQFIRIEAGEGKAVLNGEEHELKAEFAVVIPAGVKHNIINGSKDQPMKLYTLYAPANHQDGVVRATKAEAEANEEHFDGKLSEAE
ncbi:MAG: cupin domain-containing protein [bacterium]